MKLRLSVMLLVLVGLGGCSAVLSWDQVAAVAPGCGNGLLDPGEACDDGNAVDGDGCSADCSSNEACGNGILDLASDEECDDGNRISGDSCDRNCKLEANAAVCGDGVVGPGEMCDDGNTVSGDGCSEDCRSNEQCGNGVWDLHVGEACDDGNTVSGDGCSASCNSLEVCGNGITDVGEDCDDGNDFDWDGCNSCSTGEKLAHHPDVGSGAPSIAMTRDGRSTVVTWAGSINGGGDPRIFVRRFGPSGWELGPEVIVDANAATQQRDPRVSMNSSGRYVVCWEGNGADGNNFGVLGRIFDPAGIALGDEFVLNSAATTGIQWGCDVAMREDDSFIGIWFDVNVGSTIIWQRFTATGTRSGAGQSITPATQDARVAVAQDGDGIVAFSASDADPFGIFKQRFSGSFLSGGPTLVNANETGSQGGAAIGMHPDGRFVIAFIGPDAALSGIYFRRHNSSQGTPIDPSDVMVNVATAGRQSTPQAGYADDGRMVIAYTSENLDGDAFGVFFRLFDAQGNPTTDDVQVNQITSGDQDQPALAVAGDGSFTIAWHSSSSLGGSGIYVQRFDELGIPIGAAPQ